MAPIPDGGTATVQIWFGIRYDTFFTSSKQYAEDLTAGTGGAAHICTVKLQLVYDTEIYHQPRGGARRIGCWTSLELQDRDPQPPAIILTL